MPPQKAALIGRLATAETQVPATMVAASANYTLLTISDAPNGCIDDTWTATSSINAPTARDAHKAVWTGTEMIVWSGFDGNITVFNTGARYDPGTDSWAATSRVNAPAARESHTAVWTGSEMIVWGGSDTGGFLNTGGRYNPSTDGWTATSLNNSPASRKFHTAIWTDSEMIVWGGAGDAGLLNTGGRYCAQTGPTPTPTPTATSTPTPTATATAAPDASAAACLGTASISSPSLTNTFPRRNGDDATYKRESSRSCGICDRCNGY